MQNNLPKNTPTVAVIIPFYNGHDFITRAVESVLSQTTPPDEFVVVNDGSSPEASWMLHTLAEKMGFKVLDKENGGQGSARNFGVSHTTADYICFLDQDDFYLPNHIEVLLEAVDYSDKKFGWVYADLMEADGAGNIVRTGMVHAHSTHPKTNIFDLVGRDMFVLPSAALVSRTAFESVGGFDTRFMGYEDDDLFLRIFRAGFSNTFVDKPVTVWCIHPESTSYSMRMSRSRYLYFQKLCEVFPDDEDRDRFYFRDLIARRFKNLFLADAINAIRTDKSKRSERLREHQDEILMILKDFHGKYTTNKFVRRKDKLKLSIQTAILSLKSPVVAKLALIAWSRLKSRRTLPRG